MQTFIVFIPWLSKLSGARIILDIHDVLSEFYESKVGCGEHSLRFRMLLLVEKL
jgi:hypothetical protein